MRTLLTVSVLAVVLSGCVERRSAPVASDPVPATGPSSAVAARDVPPGVREEAILAGGCYWGMQEILRSVPGVITTDVGEEAHAEAVRVIFDPTRLPYSELLEKWFFKMHDPTTPNRQGNDIGPQYRSAIFVLGPEQRKTAEEVRARVDKSGKWKRPIVTEIAEATPFIRAEESHQDYLRKHVGGYTCHYIRE